MLGAMQGVTTALVSFLFVCIVFPNLVKNRAQYYAAFAAVCLIILLDALAMAIHPTEFAGFRVFAYAAVAFLQIAAIVLLFLAAGGITWRELADDMKDAYEVIRRGETDREIVIPLSGNSMRNQAERATPQVQQPIAVEEPAENIPHQGPEDVTPS
ncbi:MAG TPA: hypothetical protein VKK61_09945 [Tepidisphaeraceae bacterium]|nr:hypothetical protein [Tepidisphaeraceae bacterium]